MNLFRIFGIFILSLTLAASAAPPASQPLNPPPRPQGFSLHVKNATLQQVVDQLQPQLPPDFKLTLFGNSTASYTLDTDNLPFWHIIYNLDRQSRIVLTSTARSVTLSPPVGRTPAEPILVDTFLFIFEAFYDPNNIDEPYLSIFVFADPRVGMLQHYSGPLVTKITDPNGKPVPLPAERVHKSSIPPFHVYTLPDERTSMGVLTGVTLPAFNFAVGKFLHKSIDVASLKSLKDFQATLDFAILDKETVHTVDLAKPSDPIKTPHGTFEVNRKNSSVIVTLTPALAPVATGPRVDPRDVAAVAASRADFLAGKPSQQLFREFPVRVFDKDHRLLAFGISSAWLPSSPQTGPRLSPSPAQLTLDLPADSAPATLEISYPQSLRPCSLPIDLHDVPVRPIIFPKESFGP